MFPRQRPRIRMRAHLGSKPPPATRSELFTPFQPTNDFPRRVNSQSLLFRGNRPSREPGCSSHHIASGIAPLKTRAGEERPPCSVVSSLLGSRLRRVRDTERGAGQRAAARGSPAGNARRWTDDLQCVSKKTKAGHEGKIHALGLWIICEMHIDGHY